MWYRPHMPTSTVAFLQLFAGVLLVAFLWKVLALGLVARYSPDTAAAMSALL